MAQYTLKLSFDLRQVTQSLAYEFVHGRSGGDGYPMEDAGPLAGTFNFQPEDEIFVEVIAASAARPIDGAEPQDILESFKVNNCTFVSVPARMTEHLSLFDTGSACATIGDERGWEKLVVGNLGDNVQQMSTTSIEALTVLTKNGQWQISGYLSVELTASNGDTRAQLYFFDPEGSAGSGGLG